MNEQEMREAIYKHERKLQLLMKRIENNGSISPRNRELMMQFWKSTVARRLSKSRQEIILQSLLRFSAVSLVDWDKAEKKDIENIMAELQKQNLAETTIATMIAVLKSFWRWMHNLESSDKLPDTVRWLKCGDTLKTSKLTKKDLLTPEDIIKMIDSTSDLQTKALVSSHYEASNRCGETLSAKVGSITFFEDYATYTVEFGKTGKGEKVILQSFDLLRSWVEAHPFRHDLDHPLWIITSHMRKNRSPEEHKGVCWKCHKKTDLASAKKEIIKINKKDHEAIVCVHCGVDLNLEDLYGNPITLHYMLKIIKTAAKRAGIKKRVYSYLCRHSSGTFYYETLGEALAKKQMLHAPNTKMAGIYNHMNLESLVAGRKQAVGIENKTDKESNGVCWKCHHPNGYGASMCSKCSAPLNLEAAVNVKNVDTFDINTLKSEKMAVLKALMNEMLPEMLKEMMAEKK
ncbi:MAG: site-specific integrase [Nanoarchaeota archaeon]